jgi:hypothetical protein
MSYIKPVDYTLADHRHQHRGYMTALFEAQPKPIQWRGAGRAFVLMSHWNVVPLEVWMYFMGGRVSPPYPIENRWWLKVQHQHYIYHACKIMKPYAMIHGNLIDEAMEKMDVNRDPKAWEADDKWIHGGLITEPHVSYDGIREEDMIYHRLGYAAALLERNRTWYNLDGGHITINIRHLNPEPLNMIARFAHKVGGPDPSGGRWILTMNNQGKIRRFLSIMRDFVKIPETYNAINSLLEGKEPQKIVDKRIKECYMLTEAGRLAVGMIREAPHDWVQRNLNSQEAPNA